jgi:Uma2 family endonuclease
MSIYPSPVANPAGKQASTKLPLQSGDRLSRAEFERRYQAHPDIKAELVEGVVILASPVHYKKHADPHFNLITWLGTYSAVTPGVRGGDNATLRLDFENEYQPDALLRLEPTAGGQSVVAKDDYLEGAPEMVVEIAASSASYDMHDKRRVYARNGVPEYLVLLAYEQQIAWFVLRDGVYEPQQADERGILRSETFPGLWLEAKALLQGDMGTVLSVLQEGLQSKDHKDFVQQLQAKQGIS